jgi:hypothetical protein
MRLFRHIYVRRIHMCILFGSLKNLTFFLHYFKNKWNHLYTTHTHTYIYTYKDRRMDVSQSQLQTTSHYLSKCDEEHEEQECQ